MRYFSTTRFLLCLLAFAVAACSQAAQLPSEPPSGLSVAWFHDDCAPWDGAATTLYLGGQAAEGVFMPPYPYLRVALYSNVTQFRKGQGLQFEIPGNQGHARYCRSAEDCMNATAVRIDFTNVDAQHLEGRLEILFDGRPPIRGGFRANRIPFRALCG